MNSFSRTQSINRTKIILVTLVAAFIVGIAWEIFELQLNLTSLNDGIKYWSDMSGDLLVDLVGGYTGAKYSFYIFNKYGK